MDDLGYSLAPEALARQCPCSECSNLLSVPVHAEIWCLHPLTQLFCPGFPRAELCTHRGAGDGGSGGAGGLPAAGHGGGAGDAGMEPAKAPALWELFPLLQALGDRRGSPPCEDGAKTGSHPSCPALLGCSQLSWGLLWGCLGGMLWGGIHPLGMAAPGLMGKPRVRCFLRCSGPGCCVLWKYLCLPAPELFHQRHPAGPRVQEVQGPGVCAVNLQRESPAVITV